MAGTLENTNTKIMQLKHQKLLQHRAYVDGQFIDSLNGKTFAVFNPFNQKEVTQVADCGVVETKMAIDAANRAFSKWRNKTGIERSKILRRWYNLQLKHLEDLAVILTIEQGKPLKEARGEIKYGASFVEWFAEEAKRVYGDTILGHRSDKRIIVLKQPVGVVGAITPWNFPSAMITRKVAPALAAGCPVIIKPSELTPLSALALAVLAEEAGIPAGIFNIITTSQPEAVGLELCTNPTIRKISFTGSTKVGKILLRQSAESVKKVSMELGGNAPFIVFDDADLDKAVKGAIASKFRNAGQTCICTNRFFIQKNSYTPFIEKFSKAVQKLTLGNGLDEQVEIGPMITETAIYSVEKIVEDAVQKGANIVCGGRRILSNNSLFYPVTILSDVNPSMNVFKEEIFGPVAPVFKFETEAEVIQLANDTSYGLASYFYGRDHARIWRVAEALEYGMVGINTGMISTSVAPFGGIKESGFGREGSKYGMDDYLEMKYLCWGGVE